MVASSNSGGRGPQTWLAVEFWANNEAIGPAHMCSFYFDALLGLKENMFRRGVVDGECESD